MENADLTDEERNVVFLLIPLTTMYGCENADIW